MQRRGEDQLIRWLRRRLRAAGEDLLGDDAAILSTAGPTAVTVDRQTAGIHFPAGLDPAVAAHRLLAVNLSDLAAMGARPRYALLALAAADGEQARRFLGGVTTACRRRGVVLAGGDLSRAATLDATLTLVGEPYPDGRWVRRSLALAEDTLWVGGSLGESAAGRLLLERGADARGRRVSVEQITALPRSLRPAARRAVERHLRPPDQLDLGRWLAGRERAAAIDLSDGLAADLPRLCVESGVGALVQAEDLPTPRDFGRLCDFLGADPLRLALAGGEDYVLAFTLEPSLRPPSAFPCRAIGRIRAGRTVRLRTSAGTSPMPAGSWDHFAR